MKIKNQTQPVESLADNAKLTLEIGGRTYTSQGETILEALNNLEQPEVIKTRSVLKVEFDGKKTERGMNIIQLKRLFGKDFVRQVQVKFLERRLR